MNAGPNSRRRSEVAPKPRVARQVFNTHGCKSIFILIFRFLLQLSLAAGAAVSNSATISVTHDSVTKKTQINIDGDIKPDDGDRFSEVAHRYQDAVVSFSSTGGNLISGIQIGTIIRLRAFDTVVKRGKLCASACAYAWLAGVKRFAEDGAKIGFHAAYVLDGSVPRETGVGNALLGSYLARIGLTDEAIFYFTSAQPHEVNWLTDTIASRIRLRVSSYSPDIIIETYEEIPPNRKNPSIGNDKKKIPGESPIKLEMVARQFIRDIFSYYSTDNETALNFLNLVLAEEVDFYGKQVKKSNIVKEKMNIAKRWPVRAYVERDASLKISCDSRTRICIANGVMDWDARNPAEKRTSIGVAKFEYKIDLTRDRPRVVGERSEVIERK